MSEMKMTPRYPRIKYLEEEIRKLNLELCGVEDYIHGDFGDALTVKSKDAIVFVGTLQDLERWMQGFQFALKQSKREWVGLTGDEAREFYEKYTDREELIYAIDTFLEEKNA